MRRFWLGIVAILLIISGFIVLNSFEKKQQPILPSQGVVTYAGNVPFVEREVIPVPGYQADSLPIKEESILNNFTKRVVVSSSAEFKDINISTLVPHVSKHSIRVRYVNNSASENVGIINVEEINATVDKITWKGTSANYQVFDVGYGNYFEIIDKTSDLVAGDNWTVQFKTYAAYNLTITPIGGNFSEMKNDNLATSDDLKYLSLKCKDLYGNYVDRTNDVIVVGFDGSKRSYSTLTGQSYRAKSLFLEHNWWFSNNVNDCKLTTNILKTDAALQFNYVYLGFQSELYTIIENASSSPAVVTDCTMITEPGYYQLKSDFAENTYYINNVGNPACIHIFDTDDVSLNCRGHNISMGFYSFPGILVESNSGPFPDNITIKNCNLKYIDLYFFVNSGELINNTARSNILVWGHSYYPFPNNNINAINNRVIGGEFSLGSVGGSNFINNSVTRFYLVNSNNNNLTGNTVVGIATPGSDYFESAGIELENSNNNSFSSNDVSNSTVGFLLYYFSANNTLNNNSAHDNLVDGFSLYADSYPIYYEINNTLTNNIAYDNQGNGLRVVGHNNTIINTTLYGNAKQTSIWMPAVYNHVAYVTPYQMRVEGSELYGNHFFNTTIYTNKTGFETDRYLFQDIYSEYTTEHLPNYYSKLNLCYNESYGCVSWDNLSPEHNFNLTLTNLLLNPNFVSLDDTEYSWLNSSANITLLTNVSCFRTGYFKKSGFPQSWSDIVNNGNVINTTYSVCNEGTRIATFGVDSFSGYAPSEVLSNASNITGCINIDSPGGYQLANDLVGARNYGTFPFFNKIACIYINASNVALDCAGYNMTNNDTLFASAVLVSSGVNNIEIKNCLVINYSYGVNTGSDNTTIISNYAYSYDYGFSVNGDNNNLSDNTAYNSGYGFWFNGNNGDISNNIVYNYTSYGFYVLGAYTLLNNNLALDFRNDTNGFSAVGISAGGRNFTITNNNVTGLFGSGYGFYLDMINVSLIANNTAFGNAYSGFVIVGSTNNLFDNNSASRNGNYLDITGNYYIEAGFLLGVSPSGYSFNNLFTNNIAYENYGDGIAITGDPYLSHENCYFGNINFDNTMNSNNTFVNTILYDNAKRSGAAAYLPYGFDGSNDILKNYFEIYIDNCSIEDKFYNTTIYTNKTGNGVIPGNYLIQGDIRNSSTPFIHNTNKFYNFTVCYNETAGCINWDYVNLSDAILASPNTVVTSSYSLYLKPNLVSVLQSQFNHPANITITKTAPCADIGYFKREGTYPSGLWDTWESIVQGSVNIPITVFTPSYSSCSDSTDITTFSVDSFTGYAAGFGANLTIFDSAEGTYLEPNVSVTFYANYTIPTGEYISGADCNISFSDNWSNKYVMTDNGANYNYSRNFTSENIYQWNVSCSKLGYAPLMANDTVNISSPSPPSSSLSYLVAYDVPDGIDKLANDSIDFVANYTNSTNEPITTGTCTAYFDDSTSAAMPYSSGLYRYTKSAGFSSLGLHNWNASCTDLTYDPKTAFDNVTIVSGTQITNCILINESGNYIVSADLHGATIDVNDGGNNWKACILIAASDVNLECNSHKITNDGTEHASAIILNGSATRVVVNGCSGLLNYTDGMVIYNSNANTLTNNFVYNNSRYGLYFESSSFNTISNNNVFNNDGAGFQIQQSSDNNTITNNLIYNNHVSGLDIDSSSGNNLTNNSAYNNTLHGFWLTGSGYNNTFLYDYAYKNSNGFVIYANSTTIKNSNATDNNQIGFVIGSSSNSIRNNVVYDNHVSGLNFYSSSYNILLKNTVYNNTQTGFYIDSSSNGNIFLGSIAYGNSNVLNSGYYEIYISSNAHDNLFYNTTILTNKTNFKTYGFVYQGSTSTANNFTNLTVCYNESGGCASWDFLNLTNSALSYSNFIAAPSFISLNDSSATQFNKSANITISKNVSCADLKYFKTTGFPQTWSSIVSGSIYTPSYSICSNSLNLTMFGVPSFSGYTSGFGANLTIYPNSTSASPNSAVTFYANYTTPSGAYVPGASCNISFDDNWANWYNMTDNGNNYNYTKSGGFSDEGVHNWNVTCAKFSYESVSANSTLTVSQTPTGSNVSSLVAYDESNGTSKPVNTNIIFYANYSNDALSPISTGTCNATFDDGENGTMTYSFSTKLYSYTKVNGFSTVALHNWSVNCTDAFYNPADAVDNVDIVNAIPITACTLISSSGNYALSNNLSGATISANEFASGWKTCIKIAAPDVNLNCANYEIKNNSTAVSASAILLNGSAKRAVITGCSGIINYTDGIVIYKSHNNSVANSNIHNNIEYGFYILQSENNSIDNNIVYNNQYGFMIDRSPRNFFTGNTVFNSTDYFGFFAVQCENCSFRNNVISKNKYGINIIKAEGSVFDNNTVFNNSLAGFYATQSGDVPFRGIYNITNNSISGSTYGVYISGNGDWNHGCYRKFLNVIGNEAYNNTYGFYENCSEDTITDNKAYNNSYGFYTYTTYFWNQGLYYTGNGAMYTGNEAYNNSAIGFYIAGATNGGFCFFFNNTAHHNGADGYYSSATSCSFYNNTANNNLGVGFRSTMYGWDNTAHDNLDGFMITGSTSNDVAYNNRYGFLINSGSEVNATAYNNTVGMYVSPSNLNITYSHFYNNGKDLNVTFTGPGTLFLQGTVFDNPLGNFENYTNISLYHHLASGTASYFLNWSAEPANPGDLLSFRQKYLSITNTSGNVVIDNATWHWTDSELTPDYSESFLYVWEYNGSEWILQDFTKDNAANSITVPNLLSFSTFGVLQSNVSYITHCQEITESGDYALGRNVRGAPVPVVIDEDPGFACILVNTSNVSFNCAHHSITNNESGSTVGIVLLNTAVNVSVNNCFVTNYSAGIYLNTSNITTLENNTVFNNTDAGIVLKNSENVVMKNNNISLSEYNFYLNGNSIQTFTPIISTDNLVDGKPIYFYVYGQTGDGWANDPPSNAGYVGLVGTSNKNVRNLNLSHNGQGIIYIAGSNINITNITISDVETGMMVLPNMGPPGPFNISNIDVSDSEIGIMVMQGNILVASDLILHNISSYGIYLTSAGGPNRANNTIFNDVFMYEMPHGFINNAGLYISFDNITFGYNETIGLLNFPTLDVLDNNFDIKNNYLRLMPDHISVNSTALPSLSTDGIFTVWAAICPSKVYNKQGFPTSRDEILKTGAYCSGCTVNSCSDNVANFNVPEISGGYAVRYAGCLDPTDNTTWDGIMDNNSLNATFIVYNSVDLCRGTYYLNATGDPRIPTLFYLNNSMLNFNCNASTIIGNDSGLALYVYNDTYMNSVIENCILTNYTFGIEGSGPIINVTIRNNLLIDFKDNDKGNIIGIAFGMDDTANNNFTDFFIINNTLSNFVSMNGNPGGDSSIFGLVLGEHLNATSNVIIANNTLYDFYKGQDGVMMGMGAAEGNENTVDIYFINNTIYNLSANESGGVQVMNFFLKNIFNSSIEDSHITGLDSFNFLSAGIVFKNASGITMRNNNVSGNIMNFFIDTSDGFEVPNLIHNISTDNYMQGKPMYYYVNGQTGDGYTGDPSSDASIVALVNTNDKNVANMNLGRNGFGLIYMNGTNVNITNVSMNLTYYGMLLGPGYTWSISNPAPVFNISNIDIGLSFGGMAVSGVDMYVGKGITIHDLFEGGDEEGRSFALILPNNRSLANNLTFEDLFIYNFTDPMTRIPGDLYFINLTMGYNRTVGLIQYSNLSLNVTVNNIPYSPLVLMPFYVALNSSMLPVASKPANVTIELFNHASCPAVVYNAPGYPHSQLEFFSTMHVCDDCQIESCTDGIVRFSVTGVSGGYAAFNGTALAIYDSFEGSSAQNGSSIDFYANYTNETLQHIFGANCSIRFDDNWAAEYRMSDNGANYNFTKSNGFASIGVHYWNITCSRNGYTPFSASDNVHVTPTGGSGFVTLDGYDWIAAGLTKPNPSGSSFYDIHLADSSRSIGVLQDYAGPGVFPEVYNLSAICCMDAGDCSPEDLILYYDYNTHQILGGIGTADDYATGTCDGSTVHYYFNSTSGNLELMWEENVSNVDFDVDAGNFNVTQTFNHYPNITFDGRFNENYASESISGANSAAYRTQVGRGFQGFIGKKNESTVLASNFVALDAVTDASSKVEGRVYGAPQNITFRSPSSNWVMFNHDFSRNPIAFSNIKIIKNSNGMLVKGMQLASGETKTVIVKNSNFTMLCVKDQEILALSEISPACNGTNEISLNGCINKTELESYSGVDCYYNQTLDSYIVSNLAHTGFSFGSGNESLIINDSAENSSALPTAPVDFFAYYTDLSSNQITGAECNITFDDGSATMNESVGYYNYSRTFASDGIYIWNVTCAKSGYDTLDASDDVNISSGGGGGSTLSYLVAYDESNGTSKAPNASITFYANYTNSTGDSIATGTCTAYFDDSTSIALATYSGGLYSGAKSAGFAAEGLHQWNATCTDLTYDPKTASDYVNISTPPPPPVPEFSDFATLLILAITLSGFFIIRYKKYL